MGNSNASCCKRQSSYARYESNSKENEPDLEHVIGSLLELDPSLQDREEGVAKINSWIEEIAPDIAMSPEQLEISRWKCIKYWEAQHLSDIYETDRSMGIKLTGSCVRFYFERKLDDGPIPRLVIEHCGRSVQLKNGRARTIPAWLSNLKAYILRPFRRNQSFDSDSNSNGGELLHDSLADRYN